jgi:ABC-type uncharacterized transport system YnjBCD permease subunit
MRLPMLTSVMLIRISPPGYQVDLWLFLTNSAIGRVERVGRDAVRVSDGEPERIADALALWQDRNGHARAEIVHEA